MFNTKHLQCKKLFVATPMFGGNCTGSYTKSCIDLQKICDDNEIHVEFYYLFNESLITRARNYCVDKFLKSDCTHMMFIDGDIHFNPEDVLMSLHLCNEGTGLDIITGPYPKKSIAWDKVHAASQNGYDKNDLKYVACSYAFNLVDNSKTIDLENPLEVKEAATGFMMVHRNVFDHYSDAYPNLKFIPDHAGKDEQMTAFFDCGIDPESKRYLSEDYMFSYNARKIGRRVWMCPWMKLNHIGTSMFTGDMKYMTSKPKKTPKKNLTKLC